MIAFMRACINQQWHSSYHALRFVSVVCSGIFIILLCFAFSPASCHVAILAAALLFVVVWVFFSSFSSFLMNSDDVRFNREAQPVKSVVEVVKVFFPLCSAARVFMLNYAINVDEQKTKKKRTPKRRSARRDEPNPIFCFHVNNAFPVTVFVSLSFDSLLGATTVMRIMLLKPSPFPLTVERIQCNVIYWNIVWMLLIQFDSDRPKVYGQSSNETLPPSLLLKLALHIFSEGDELEKRIESNKQKARSTNKQKSFKFRRINENVRRKPFGFMPRHKALMLIVYLEH